jgi:hypothetical protein
MKWIYRLWGYSTVFKYTCPIKPREGEKPRFWKDSPTHSGPYINAVDIIIPDPRIKVLPVIVPMTGIVTKVVQHHTRWGDDPRFLPFLNFIRIRTGITWYEICHIGANSCPPWVMVGKIVRRGQVLATTGVNGYMTDPRHIHFMVAVGNIQKREFQSLKIRWRV